MSVRQLIRYLLCIIAAAALSGCSVIPTPWSGEQTDTSGEQTLPATYRGLLPCADCAGQRWTLTLFDDLTFRLRTTYLDAVDDNDRDFYSRGRWARAQDDSDRLRLTRGKEPYHLFRFATPERLRLMNLAGDEIESDLNYELTRADEVDELGGPMPLTGLYRYMADAAVFVECDSGMHYPVLIQEDHLAVERAYLSARGGPGESILLVISGRFIRRAPEPGIRERVHVAFEGHGEFRPGEGCPR